ncbi:hypothetical protein ACFQY5_21445 [Paeniroseomonas aquatica]|uniref:hypothetical protein n=1 Tax=Paeniroseomonas aquatica TaxID=373043 RepID=UPI0036205AE6
MTNSGLPFDPMRGVPSASFTGTCAPRVVACRLPLAKSQVPVTWNPPGTTTAAAWLCCAPQASAWSRPPNRLRPTSGAR